MKGCNEETMKKKVFCKSCKSEGNTKLSQLAVFGSIELGMHAPLLARVLDLSGR